MTDKFEVNTSHHRLRAHSVQVRAGLTAIPELAAKAADWDAQRQRIIGHRAAWEDGQDAVTVAQTINRVRDTNWDASYTEGSGIAFLLAKKKKHADPYATEFRVAARRATGFGHVKATEIGDKAITSATRFQLPALDGWVQAFTPTNEALKASGKAMEAAEDALDDPRFSKKALVRAHNELIAVTEAFILSTFPGRGDLADAILIPSWERRGKKGADDDDDVVVGPTDDSDGDAPPEHDRTRGVRHEQRCCARRLRRPSRKLSRGYDATHAPCV